MDCFRSLAWKEHLAKVLFFESLYLWILSVGGGILLGILCYKLLFLVLLKLTRFQGQSICFNWKATGNTVVLFAVIFLINYLKSLHQIHAAQPIELLHGEQEGEREPKTKLLTAWIGLLCLGLGYYLALTCQNPMEALGKFFGAVLLVMAGTYCLFSAGSIALLKLLKSNKRYYYQTRHFTSISGMLYRMKQNANGTCQHLHPVYRCASGNLHHQLSVVWHAGNYPDKISPSDSGGKLCRPMVTVLALTKEEISSVRKQINNYLEERAGVKTI